MHGVTAENTDVGAWGGGLLGLPYYCTLHAIAGGECTFTGHCSIPRSPPAALSSCFVVLLHATGEKGFGYSLSEPPTGIIKDFVIQVTL